MVLCFLNRPADGPGDEVQPQCACVFASSLYLALLPSASTLRCCDHSASPVRPPHQVVIPQSPTPWVACITVKPCSSGVKLPTFLMSAPSVGFPPHSSCAPLRLRKVAGLLATYLRWVENSGNSLRKSEIVLAWCTSFFLITEHKIEGGQVRRHSSQLPQKSKERDWHRFEFIMDKNSQNSNGWTSLFPHRWKDEGPANEVLTAVWGSSSQEPSVDNFKQTCSNMCFCEFKLLLSFHESTKYTFFPLVVTLYTHWSCKGTRRWLYFRDQKRESFPSEGKDIMTHNRGRPRWREIMLTPERPTEGLVIFSRRTFVHRITVSVDCFWIRTKVCSSPP